MENKTLIEGLRSICSDRYFSGVSELCQMSSREDITRTDILQWLGDNLPDLLRERETRPLLTDWVNQNLFILEKQDLHVITHPYTERPTADGRRWYFLNFGEGDPAIRHMSGIEASYYGKCEVCGVDLESDRVEAYDVVRVAGNAVKGVAYHDYAGEMDQRPFYVEGSYLQDPETVERWNDYLDKGDTDSVLMEADCYVDGYEDTVELTEISRQRPGSAYSGLVCENAAYCVVKESHDAYLVVVKESPARILEWWNDSREHFVGLSDDLKDLIRQDTQREFECYPHRMIPLPGIDGYWAYFRPEADELVIRPYDSEGIHDIVIPYDFNLRDVHKNVQRGMEALQGEGINEELKERWRSFAGIGR